MDWFFNDLEPFGETLQQPYWVQPRPNRLRPVVTILDEHHPLSVAQREGITADRVRELCAFYGHPAD